MGVLCQAVFILCQAAILIELNIYGFYYAQTTFAKDDVTNGKPSHGVFLFMRFVVFCVYRSFFKRLKIFSTL